MIVAMFSTMTCQMSTFINTNAGCLMILDVAKFVLNKTRAYSAARRNVWGIFHFYPLEHQHIKT